ncbi:hypothetical protein J003_00001 [Cryptococcus neoformans]|nr:hypothetical protein J003_00001 [Cryptococcus neoformans var. grubii]
MPVGYKRDGSRQGVGQEPWEGFPREPYGQKLPLMNPFILSEPAQPNHPLADMNEWDIGITTNASHIFLFGPIGTRPSGMRVYPMVIPRSND